MIGPRVGAKVGPRVGIAAGVSADEIGSSSSWTVDATSGWSIPASSAEWTAFLAAKGLSGSVAVPGSTWNMNESSGDLADTIGGITLAAGGTVAYGQSAPGWSKTGVGLSDGAISTFGSASASLPNANAGSQTVIVIGIVTVTPAANRQIYVGPSNTLRISSTPRTSATAIANVATGTVNPLNAVRPWGYRHNLTATTQMGFTDQEKLSPVYQAISGNALRFGSTSAAGPGGVLLYGIAWYNANAEISDANLSALLTAMGATMAW